MLPGKKYTPEEVLRIAKKRIWLIIIPFALVAAGTAVVSKTLPDIYSAETTILVVPQRIPEAYVKSTVTMRIEDRMVTIKQQLYSRTLLEATIKEFNLYPDMRRAGTPMEDIVGKMRNELKTDVYKGEAFRIWYTGTDPSTVMKVVERLTSTFIDQSIRDRSVIADGTNQFLQQQALDARRRLLEQEKKLEEYNQKYSGELPTQQQANMQAVSNLQMQIRSVLTQIETTQGRRQDLERDLSDAEMAIQLFPPTPPPPVTAGPPEAVVGTAAQQLAAKRGELAQAQARKWTDEHPVVRAIRRDIAELEKRAEAEALQQPVTPQKSITAITFAQFAHQKKIEGMQLQVQAYTKQIADLQAEEKRLRQLADMYQHRVDMAPARASELVELTREYGSVQGLHSSLLSKMEESKLAAEVEQRQIGEQFRLLDPARLPEKPIRPNRQVINLGGAALGLAVGILLVTLVEWRDSSFRTDDEVSTLLTLPVLAVVPHMQSDDDRARAKRRRLVMNVGLGSTVIGCLAVLVYTLVR
jgi:polysaccharide chain length determinant protein (PEP-CTERM system associated)